MTLMQMKYAIAVAMQIHERSGPQPVYHPAQPFRIY